MQPRRRSESLNVARTRFWRRSGRPISTKSGKGRHIVPNDEGPALFESLVAGYAGEALLLVKADGSQWGKSHQTRPMEDACERAKITPAASIHIPRHTWASLAVTRPKVDEFFAVGIRCEQLVPTSGHVLYFFKSLGGFAFVHFALARRRGKRYGRQSNLHIFCNRRARYQNKN
jgi:hypothetical protein